MISQMVIHSRRRVAVWLICCITGFTAAAQCQTTHRMSSDTPTLHQRYPRYMLHSGDSFSATFQFSPEFNQTLVVQPDGFVSFREIGDLHVAGLTLPQVRSLLTTKYSTILKQPVISITPVNLDKNYFIASGEVAHPGKYELRGPITVTEALAIAGGLAPDRSKLSEVVLFRKVGNTLAPGQVINIKKMLKQRNLAEDIYVSSGDLLYVPQNQWSKVRQVLPTPGVGMQIVPGGAY